MLCNHCYLSLNPATSDLIWPCHSMRSNSRVVAALDRCSVHYYCCGRRFASLLCASLDPLMMSPDGFLNVMLSPSVEAFTMAALKPV